ncbi:hypothetical protein [Paraburkholderia dinghuensis]|uniref:Uncharacterized protein n=1 Tax=Paraburkholderia dinghuensis TaxID=2305225 RepID=A0A3N6Q694_9BURK|nr:hypothetical protein [Paraburkholderia dinghuensis]RQH07986.1 hypothetical protein D1Y85_07750 [Paraburkholderia dinghuensis]
MKASTLMTSVLLSASCFAAPVRTAQEVPVYHGSAPLPFRAEDVPVAPPAPDVPVARTIGPEHWEYVTLPKSRRLDRALTPVLHQQT